MSMQYGSNNMALGLTSSAAAVNPVLTSDTDRPVILGALTLLSGRGLCTALRVASWDLNWSNAGFPVSIFGLNSGVNEENYANIAVFPGQAIDGRFTLDAAGVVGGMWAIDDLESDEEAMALVQRLVKSQRPPGRINWVFGLGEVTVAAGAAATLTANAARAGNGPGQLVLDIAGAPVVGDLDVTGVTIQNVDQKPNARPIDALAFQPGNFNRNGIYIQQGIGINTPVAVQLFNNSAGPLTVSGAFINKAPSSVKRARAGMGKAELQRALKRT